MAIPNKVGEQSWAKVSSQIDGIASLPSESGANAEDQKEEHEGGKIARAEVAVIFQSENREHEHGTCNELGEKLARLGHEWLRIGAEDTSSRVCPRDGSDVRAALVCVNGRLVVAIYDSSAAEAARYLSTSICGPLAPGKLPEHAVCESDGRVEMPSCAACGVNSKHHAASSTQDLRGPSSARLSTPLRATMNLLNSFTRGKSFSEWRVMR